MEFMDFSTLDSTFQTSENYQVGLVPLDTSTNYKYKNQ